ncbi:restriction endonuclease subunit S [Streptococcus infantarius]|uniref:restriction endonuclease subunit S n=1 Tax=Streptococcus infantarius TaxID=102684 RepID=UPI003D13A0CB
MKDTNKLNPEIRFSGFTDDWEQHKLGELGRATGGTSIESEFSENGKYKVISIGSYSEDSVYREQGIRAIESEKTKNRVLNEGDLTMILNDKTTSGNIIGRVLLIEKSDVYVYNQRTERIEINHDKFDSLFVYEMLNAPRIRNKIIKQSQGNTQIYVNWSMIAETRYLIPQIAEQQKIGEYFSNLDRLITLHQRKLNGLKNVKKAMLEKMFPKSGEKIPEIRFSGFTDDWEQRKFKDIIEKLTGGASIKPSDYLEEGIRTIPKGAVNSTGLADLSGSKYISEEFYESNKSSHVSTNNLVTSLRDLVPSAPNMGRIVRIAGEDEDFLMPQGVYKLELFDGMDEEFLIAFSNSDKYRKIISSEKNGSTQVHIRNGEFLNIDIELPFSEEQKQIGSFFKQLDNSITLHQRKLDKLKTVKKAMLEKMFI